MLADFAIQLACGLVCMLVVVAGPAVSAGFFRVHLLVVLGLLVLAWLIAAPGEPEHRTQGALLLTAAALSFLASAAWLVGRPSAGRVLLAIVAIVCLLIVTLRLVNTRAFRAAAAPAQQAVVLLDGVTAAWLLGAATASMLLGHWYLITPGMSLQPLRRLVLLLAAAAVVRGAVAAPDTLAWISRSPTTAAASALAPPTASAWFLALVALRWVAGIVGPLVTGHLVWQTLKIRSTQSATGILYVTVILVFLGEMLAKVLTTYS